MNTVQLIVFVSLVATFFVWSEWKQAKFEDSAANVPTELNYDSGKNINETYSDDEKRGFDWGAALFVAIFTLVPLVGGYFGINYWFKQYNLASESVDWTPVEAVLVRKHIEESGRTTTTSNNETITETIYIPKVEYKFQHNGKVYNSTGIDFKNKTVSRSPGKAKEELSQLPDEGSKLTIYFDEKSGKSVIYPGSSGSEYFLLIISSFFFWLGLLAVRFVYRSL